RELIAEAKEALQYLGFPIVQAKEEGEAQAAQLAQKKLAYAAATQDYDALLFGSPIVIRNMGVTGKRKIPYRNAYVNVEPELVDLEKVLSELKLTRQQLIWIGMLIGTDYNEKIPLVGPKKAIKAVEGKESFEEVIFGLKKEIDYNWKEVEFMFTNPTVHDLHEIPSAQLDHDRAIAFYCDKHGFDHVRVTNALNKIAKKPEDEKQSTLGKWG
ncbi:MAG: flap structure-specific endonuclease, partial [archaeon]